MNEILKAWSISSIVAHLSTKADHRLTASSSFRSILPFLFLNTSSPASFNSALNNGNNTGKCLCVNDEVVSKRGPRAAADNDDDFSFPSWKFPSPFVLLQSPRASYILAFNIDVDDCCENSLRTFRRVDGDRRNPSPSRAMSSSSPLNAPC